MVGERGRHSPIVARRAAALRRPAYNRAARETTPGGSLMATAAPGADAIVVGGGLAGLVATAELTARGRRVVLVDQEPEASLGGQAFWSLGGLFLVDSPEQRRMGIRDSHALAWQDWLGT